MYWKCFWPASEVVGVVAERRDGSERPVTLPEGCPVCGNGAVEFGEECDDGNVVTEECSYQETACQVCDSDCNLLPGATSFCGDGIVAERLAFGEAG